LPVSMYDTGLIPLQRPRLRATCLSFLRLYGRTAFSNYLGQTVICVLPLQPLASAGHVSAPAALGIWAVIIILQCALSTVWLHFFRYGHLEWLWRCGTYWELRPLRSPEADPS